ncbi:AAA family ATPase [Streptomyces sp. NBC_00400]|uniref:AAA family ATPase n=1 Tax=Streptomyces sp. NBC_00400 TaxID=2975737 RepID=UPI002E204057
MVGPNAAGKSNVLHALEFLRDVTRMGIEPDLEEQGGFDVLAFRGDRKPVSRITIGIEGIWSDFASEEAPDRYELSVSRSRVPDEVRERHSMYRRESFAQHPAESTETSVDERLPDGQQPAGRRRSGRCGRRRAHGFRAALEGSITPVGRRQVGGTADPGHPPGGCPRKSRPYCGRARRRGTQGAAPR